MSSNYKKECRKATFQMEWAYEDPYQGTIEFTHFVNKFNVGRFQLKDAKAFLDVANSFKTFIRMKRKPSLPILCWQGVDEP